MSDVEPDDEEAFMDEIVRAKWIMDGSATLTEAAVRVRAFANHLDALVADGFELTAPVQDDYGFYRKTET